MGYGADDDSFSNKEILEEWLDVEVAYQDYLAPPERESLLLSCYLGMFLSSASRCVLSLPNDNC